MTDQANTDALTPTTEKRRRRGAPDGNANAVRHGLRGSGLPANCGYLDGQLRSFRRYLHSALEEKHGSGKVTIYQEALIQSAQRHEMRALLAARWLRKEADSLDVTARLSLVAAIANASDSRDKCLKSLGLDEMPGQGDAWQAMYDQPPVAPPQPTPETPANASPRPDAPTIADEPDDATPATSDNEGPDSDATVRPDHEDPAR